MFRQFSHFFSVFLLLVEYSVSCPLGGKEYFANTLMEGWGTFCKKIYEVSHHPTLPAPYEIHSKKSEKMWKSKSQSKKQLPILALFVRNRHWYKMWIKPQCFSLKY